MRRFILRDTRRPKGKHQVLSNATELYLPLLCAQSIADDSVFEELTPEAAFGARRIRMSRVVS
jgi:hypothetical protein